MYGVAMQTPQQFGELIAVSSVDDLAYLVKESELQTGMAGREVMLRAGAQCRTYQVCYDGTEYLIRGVGESSDGREAKFIARELAQSEFGEAMVSHRLFCRTLPEGRPCCTTKTA